MVARLRMRRVAPAQAALAASLAVTLASLPAAGGVAGGVADDALRLPALVTWVQENGGWLNPSLELRDGRHGASMFATAPIRRGEPLVRTPLRLTLSGDTVLRRLPDAGGGTGPLASALRRLLALNQTSEAVSLFLASQRSSNGREAGDTFLRPFVASMPAAIANALAFSAAELGALRGSGAEAVARGMQQTAARQFAHLRETEPLLFGGNDESRGPISILEEDMLWATSMVMSRGFGVAMPPPEAGASAENEGACSAERVLRHMVPLMDTFVK